MVDPKELNDEEFARAFQQLIAGEKVTGKPWSPSWKEEACNSPAVAALATAQTLDWWLEDQFLGEEGTMMRSQTSDRGSKSGHVDIEYHMHGRKPEWAAVSLMASARRYLISDQLARWTDRGTWHEHATWRSSGPFDGMVFRRARPRRSDAYAKLYGADGFRRALLSTVNLREVYRLSREGQGTAKHKDLMQRVVWARNHPEHFFWEVDTKHWYFLNQAVAMNAGTAEAEIEWMGLDETGKRTRRARLIVY